MGKTAVSFTEDRMERQESVAIDVTALRFSYPSAAFSLEIPRLEIAAGERVAVIGPSGCGKTTLLNLLSGVLVPTAGRVSVLGEDVSAHSAAERRRFRITRLGLVLQSLHLVEYLDVLDNILHCYRITPALRLDTAVRERAAELARGIGLGERLHRPVAELSQGERQRVAICRALLAGPEVLLADEATGNLDPANKGRILDLIFERLAAGGQTLLAVTHDHALLDRFDRVIELPELLAT
jgi:ABC-type lipoprotein export system ATPase subunit